MTNQQLVIATGPTPQLYCLYECLWHCDSSRCNLVLVNVCSQNETDLKFFLTVWPIYLCTSVAASPPTIKIFWSPRKGLIYIWTSLFYCVNISKRFCQWKILKSSSRLLFDQFLLSYTGFLNIALYVLTQKFVFFSVSGKLLQTLLQYLTQFVSNG